MALNLNTIVPASLKAKEVATVDYVDTTTTDLLNYTDSTKAPITIMADTTTIDGGKIATNSIWVGGNIKTYNYNWNGGMPLGFGLFSQGENDSLHNYNIVGGKMYGGNIDGAIITGAIFDISTAKMQSTYSGNLGSFFPASYTCSAGTVYSNYFYSPSYGTGYNANRITRDNTEFLIQVSSSSSFYLAYQINDGAWIDFSDTPSTSPIPNAHAGSYTFNFVGGKIRFKAVGSGRMALTVTAPSTYVNRYNATYTTAGTFTFTVPANITQITYVVYGGGGGGGAPNSDGDCHTGSGGGAGGKQTGILTVTPGEALTVIVGSKGYGASFRFNGNYSWNYNDQGQAISLGSGTAGGPSYLKRGSTVLATATGGGAGCLFCGGGAGGTPTVDGTNNGYGTEWVKYGGTSYGGTNGSGVPPTVYSTGSGYGNGGGDTGCSKGANGQNGAVFIYWEINT